MLTAVTAPRYVNSGCMVKQGVPSVSFSLEEGVFLHDAFPLSAFYWVGTVKIKSDENGNKSFEMFIKSCNFLLFQCYRVGDSDDLAGVGRFLLRYAL